MTKNEAKQSICSLPDGTLATLTGITKYDEIDCKLMEYLNKIDEVDVSGCKVWQEVWNSIK